MSRSKKRMGSGRAPALHLRRDVLAGLSVLACLPAVRGALAKAARQERRSATPLRFVMLFTGNGQTPEQWVPTGGTSDFVLSPALAPLEPHRNKLLVVHGLRGSPAHSGGMTETTTGRPPANFDGVATAGPSIDQYLAGLWGEDSPLPSFDLAVRPGNDRHDQICYSPRGFAVPPIGSPAGAFDRVFAATHQDPRVAEQRRRQQLSVLDNFVAELQTLQGRLGSTSRNLLDEHLTLMREREVELQKPVEPLVCDIHEMGEHPGDSVELGWRLQTDNIVAALRCGATRVASLRIGGWGGIEEGDAYTHLGIELGHHAVSHGEGTDPAGAQLAINRWHCEQLVDLVAKLDAIPEGDGTLLDHTCVVWFNELGLGPMGNHGRADTPVVMVGGARAGFAQGRYLQFADDDYQHFLYTMARTLGESTLASFGDRGNQLLGDLLA